jgi:methyl-accepting chemotaxis protein
LESFYANLNALDWENEDSWENFANVIKELGLNIPENELESFIGQAKLANNAISKFNLDKIVEEIKKVGPVIKNILEGTQERAFSTDDYNSLIAIVPDLTEQFIQNIDGTFVYLGDSFEELATRISEGLQNKIVTNTETL